MTQQEMIEIAACLRIGAQQDRKNAEAQDALTVKNTLLRSAEFREALAERFQKAASVRPKR
jgi:hypothetical protein